LYWYSLFTLNIILEIKFWIGAAYIPVILTKILYTSAKPFRFRTGFISAYLWVR